MEPIINTEPENNSSSTPKITLNTDRLVRMAASIILTIVVISSAAMSWSGLFHLGEMAGMGAVAFLLPISIDGMLLLGSLQTLHAVLGNRKSRQGLLLTIVGVALSIGGNMIGASNLGWLASSVHAIPPLMLFLSLNAFEGIMKHRIQSEQKAVNRAVKRSKQAAKAKPVSSMKTRQIEAQRLPAPTPRVVPSVDDDELVRIGEMLPEGASKTDKIRVILAEMPNATASVVANIMGEESAKTIANSVSRVRKELESREEDEGTTMKLQAI